MALYFFDLERNDRLVDDCDGTDLDTDQQAREHALAVVRELKKHREVDCRTWRIRVCNSRHAPLFDVPFDAEDDART